jgi:hypothetical protein
MKKLLLILTVVSLLAVNTQVVSARGVSAHVSPHVSPHVSTPHTSTPHTSTPHSTSHSTPRSSRVGTAPLRSRTTPPRPHTYNGRTYNSSSAQYTNTNGLWVYYWLLIPNSTTGKKDLQCFDKNHKRVTCNRDSKSYQKDW